MLGGVPYLGTLRNLLVGACALLFLCTAGSSSVANRGQAYRYSYENVLGTSLDLKIVAASEGAADRAQQKALDEIDRLCQILSGYDPASEFSRWVQTRNRRVPVSPELFEVLRLFDQWRERTGGALDASAETITRLWKHAASEQRLPTSAELEEVVASVRQEHWQLDNAAHTATHLTDAPLVLNSFAKSYIVNRAAEAAMRSDGVTGVVVDIGGDLVVRGAITDRSRLQIRSPMRRTANRSRVLQFTTGPSPRAEAIGAALKSGDAIIRISSTRARAERRRIL